MPVEIGLEALLSKVTQCSSRRVVVEGHRAVNDGVVVGNRPVGLLLVDNRKEVVGQWIRVPDDEEEGGDVDGDEGVHGEEADGMTLYSEDVEDRAVVAGTCKGQRMGMMVGRPWEAFPLIQEEDLQSIHLRFQMPSSGGDGGRMGANLVDNCYQQKHRNDPNKGPETVFCLS